MTATRIRLGAAHADITVGRYTYDLSEHYMMLPPTGRIVPAKGNHLHEVAQIVCGHHGIVSPEQRAKRTPMIALSEAVKSVAVLKQIGARL